MAFEPSSEAIEFEARTDTEFVLGSAVPHRYLMKALMDEVQFEEGGAVVRMRKSAGQTASKDTQKNLPE